QFWSSFSWSFLLSGNAEVTNAENRESLPYLNKWLRNAGGARENCMLSRSFCAVRCGSGGKKEATLTSFQVGSLLVDKSMSARLANLMGKSHGQISWANLMEWSTA